MGRVLGDARNGRIPRVSPGRPSHDPHQGQFYPLKYPGEEDLRVPSSCSKHNSAGLSHLFTVKMSTCGAQLVGRNLEDAEARREGRAQGELPGLRGPSQALLTSWAQHRPQRQGPGISKPSLREHGKKPAPLLQTRPSTPSTLMRHLWSLPLLPRAHLSGNVTSSGSTGGGGRQESRGMDWDPKTRKCPGRTGSILVDR